MARSNKLASINLENDKTVRIINNRKFNYSFHSPSKVIKQYKILADHIFVIRNSKETQKKLNHSRMKI